MNDIERDFVEFEDDEGNTFELDVIDYFDHDGENYAILVDMAQYDGDEDLDDDAPIEQEIYILKVITNDDCEEFVEPDEEKMPELIEITEKLLNELSECECGCGCDCGHDHED